MWIRSLAFVFRPALCFRKIQGNFWERGTKEASYAEGLNLSNSGEQCLLRIDQTFRAPRGRTGGKRLRPVRNHPSEVQFFRQRQHPAALGVTSPSC
jgi:hypothetical protein